MLMVIRYLARLLKKTRQYLRAAVHRKNIVHGAENNIPQSFFQKNSIHFEIHGDKNTIIAPEEFKNTQITLNIYGNDNIVEIGESDEWRSVVVEIFGDNNRFTLQNKTAGDFWAALGCDPQRTTTGSFIEIGANTSSNGLSMRLLENGSRIRIGRDCMFSSPVALWATDTHSVVNLQGDLLNYGHSVEIGDHVWVGADVTILKNTEIADHCIVGWKSVVTKKFTQPHTAIAGNPATIVKTDVSWDRLHPDAYKAANPRHSSEKESDKKPT